MSTHVSARWACRFLYIGGNPRLKRKQCGRTWPIPSSRIPGSPSPLCLPDIIQPDPSFRRTAHRFAVPSLNRWRYGPLIAWASSWNELLGCIRWWRSILRGVLLQPNIPHPTFCKFWRPFVVLEAQNVNGGSLTGNQNRAWRVSSSKVLGIRSLSFNLKLVTVRHSWSHCAACELEQETRVTGSSAVPAAALPFSLLPPTCIMLRGFDIFMNWISRLQIFSNYSLLIKSY